MNDMELKRDQRVIGDIGVIAMMQCNPILILSATFMHAHTTDWDYREKQNQRVDDQTGCSGKKGVNQPHPGLFYSITIPPHFTIKNAKRP